MNNDKLENIEAITCLIIISINSILLSTSQALVKQCSSSSLINVIFITIITLIITFIFCFLSKSFIGRNILDISEFLGGRFFKIFVGLLFSAYLTYRSAIFIKRISNCLQIVYYPMTNIIFIITLFCIATVLVNFLKNNSIFKSTVLITPLLFATVILVFIGNTKNFNFENIYPLLGNGIKTTFFSGLTNIFSFSGLIYMFFLPSKLKNPEKYTKIALSSILLTSIFLLFSVACLMLFFNDTLTSSELFPFYVSVRYIEFGTFFQRLDAIFLFLCIFGFICVFSLNTFIVTDILKNICNLSDRKPLTFPYILIVFGIALSIRKNSNLEFLSTNISRILFLIIAIIIPFLILLSANIKNNGNTKNLIGGKK